MSSDDPSVPPEPAGASEEESGEGRMAARLKKLDSAPWLIRAAQALRNTLGRPRRLGGDYYGVDVNIAARVATAAGPGEVLVSDATLHRLDSEALELKRRYRFRGKGAPKDLKVYTAEAAG